MSDLSLMQKWALAYAILFVFVVALGYVPGFTDDQGNLFGLFKIELHDDLLHLGSGIWAAIAAWLSTRASTIYFKLFGVVYGLDGIVGLITGYGYLDGGVFFNAGHSHGLDLLTRFAANIPHIAIGGVAVYIGYVLSRKVVDPA